MNFYLLHLSLSLKKDYSAFHTTLKVVSVTSDIYIISEFF